MKMIYEVGPKKGQEVQIGDVVDCGRGKEIVTGFELPRHAASSGRVHIKADSTWGYNEYFPHVYGLAWAGRTDRE